MHQSLNNNKSYMNINNKTLITKISKQKYSLTMVIPIIAWLVVFCYYPMYGLIIAFKNYNIGVGILGSPWIGFKYFHELIMDPYFFNAFWNTLLISFLKLICGFPIPIIFALMLNELRGVLRFKKVIQTLTYLPYFLSWVFVTGFLVTFFSDKGIYNTILISLGFLDKPTSLLTNPPSFIAIIVLSDIWKGFGFSSIIFLAAISSIDTEQYEAASIDGATRLQQIWNVTLPAIKLTTIVLLILSISGLVNGNFEQMYLLMNNLVRDNAEILSTYTYEIGIRSSRFSYATAVGMFTSVVSFTFLFSANAISRKVADTSLF